MRDFFHGWRRKLGCVALLTACVVTAGWCRSAFVSDCVEIACGDYVFYSASSTNDGVELRKWIGIGDDWPISFQSWVPDRNVPVILELTDTSSAWMPDRQWEWARFRIRLHRSYADVTIPYSFIDCPLILLSTYLLLVRQTSKKPAPDIAEIAK